MAEMAMELVAAAARRADKVPFNVSTLCVANARIDDDYSCMGPAKLCDGGWYVSGYGKNIKCDYPPSWAPYGLLLFLVFLIALFTAIRQVLDKYVIHEYVPVLHAFFAELATLGFVSLVAFLVGHQWEAGSNSLMDDVGYALGFGNTLYYTFDHLHWFLFGLSIAFILITMFILRVITTTFGRYESWSRQIEEGTQVNHDLPRVGDWSVPTQWLRSRTLVQEREFFLRLFERFVDRDTLRPGDIPIGNSFNLGKYFILCCSHMMSELLEVPIPEWLLLTALSIGPFIGYHATIGSGGTTDAGYFVFWVYEILVIVFAFVLDRKLHTMLMMLTPLELEHARTTTRRPSWNNSFAGPSIGGGMEELKREVSGSSKRLTSSIVHDPSPPRTEKRSLLPVGGGAPVTGGTPLAAAAAAASAAREPEEIDHDDDSAPAFKRWDLSLIEDSPGDSNDKESNGSHKPPPPAPATTGSGRSVRMYENPPPRPSSSDDDAARTSSGGGQEGYRLTVPVGGVMLVGAPRSMGGAQPSIISSGTFALPPLPFTALAPLSPTPELQTSARDAPPSQYTDYNSTPPPARPSRTSPSPNEEIIAPTHTATVSGSFFGSPLELPDQDYGVPGARDTRSRASLPTTPTHGPVHNGTRITFYRADRRVSLEQQDKFIPRYVKHHKMLTQRSWLNKLFRGRVINAHQSLFWGGSHGPEFMLRLIRMTALSAVVMVTSAAENYRNHMLCTGLDYNGRCGTYTGGGVVVLILSLSLPIIVAYLMPNIIRNFVIVTSVEMMKDRKTIAYVENARRTQRTKTMVDALVSLGQVIDQIESLTDIAMTVQKEDEPEERVETQLDQKGETLNKHLQRSLSNMRLVRSNSLDRNRKSAEVGLGGGGLSRAGSLDQEWGWGRDESSLQAEEAKLRKTFEAMDKTFVDNLRELFNEVDDERTGFLDRTRLSSLLEATGTQVDENTVEVLFQLMDFQGKGTVRFEEFCVVFFREGHSRVVDPAQLVDKVWRLFDPRNTGRITPEQVQQTLKRKRPRYDSQKVVNVIRHIDVDARGWISKADFQSFVSATFREM